MKVCVCGKGGSGKSTVVALRDEITKYLTMLTNDGMVKEIETEGRTYYLAIPEVI